MVLVKKSVTLTEQQDEWIKRQVEAGRYANESELLRDLIRKEQDKSRGAHLLRHALLEGRASGVSPLDAEQVFAQAKLRVTDG